MIKLSLGLIEKAVEGRMNDRKFFDIRIEGVSTDTRNDDVENSLFIPISGDTFDGHSFISQAFDKGAVCCLSEEKEEITENKKLNKHPIIYVESTKKAIMKLAEEYIRFMGVKTVGITGSAGKTTTKDIVANVLSEKYDVLKTEGNFNNNIGLPLTVFNIDKHHEIAVLEMGMNNSGEIRELSKVIKPDICVITNIGTAHIGNLGSIDGVLSAKCEIFDYMKKDGKGVINGDDDNLKKINRENVLYFGTNSDNDFYGTDIKYNGLSGSSFVLNKRTNDTVETIDINLSVPGKHMITNALCGGAVGSLLSLSLEEIKKGLETFKLPEMRMSVLINKEKTIFLVDDSYNANPQSMKAAIDVLDLAKGEKICVLGGMLELGEKTKDYHTEIGQYCSDKKIDKVISIGNIARDIHESVKGNSESIYFDYKEDGIIYLTEYIKNNRNKQINILVKASRGLRFETIVNSLKESFDLK